MTNRFVSKKLAKTTLCGKSARGRTRWLQVPRRRVPQARRGEARPTNSKWNLDTQRHEFGWPLLSVEQHRKLIASVEIALEEVRRGRVRPPTRCSSQESVRRRDLSKQKCTSHAGSFRFQGRQRVASNILLFHKPPQKQPVCRGRYASESDGGEDVGQSVCVADVARNHDVGQCVVGCDVD
jgi:hypothetical protein